MTSTVTQTSEWHTHVQFTSPILKREMCKHIKAYDPRQNSWFAF